MIKSKTCIVAILFLGSSILLSSCGGEPAGEHLPPETTQGDYLGNDDLDTTGAVTDTATTEYE